MPLSNTPQFWLQVRKEYIFDNFDNLLNYLRFYRYSDLKDGNPDYDSTLNCMMELSNEYCDIIESTPFFENLVLGRDINSVARLLLSTILAAQKAGFTPHRIICSTIDLFIKSGTKIKEDEIFMMYDIVLHCLRGLDMTMSGFSWTDVISLSGSLDVVAIKFLQMQFSEVSDSPASVYLENNGLLVVPPSSAPVLFPSNLAAYKKGNRQIQLTLPDLLDVEVPRNEYEKIRDIDELNKVCSNFLTMQSQMKPSPTVSKLDYSMDDEFIVKVVDRIGSRIVGETIDPRYNKIAGNVLINLPTIHSSNEILREAIVPGTFLTVLLMDSGNSLKFETGESFEFIYRTYAARHADSVHKAIYVSNYPQGLQFITEDGVYVGVDKSKYETLDNDNLHLLIRACDDGLPIRLRFYDRPPDVERDSFFMYAEFPEERVEVVEDETEHFTVHDAQRSMIQWYLSFSEQSAIMRIKSDEEFREGDSRMFVPLVTVINYFLGGSLTASRDKLEYAAAVEMLCKILGREKEMLYADHERKYLSALMQFAHNKEVKEIRHTEALDGIESVGLREKIVESLVGYKNKKVTKGEESLRMNMGGDLLEKVETLVNASNNLIDIIDEQEVNNIKQAIARTLEVGDEYVSILDDRTYYGRESINLEFKTTVVFPPANRRRIASSYADPEVQKWAIIKSVCGFLNSRGGGELLIGVNDAGYAVGLEDDIKALVALKAIYIGDEDHYRTYIQNILDYAFREYGEKGYNTDVARTHVSYVFEENAEGKTILRIKVKPYEPNLVELAADNLPEGIESSFVRRNGRTVYVTDAIRRDIMRYKKA